MSSDTPTPQPSFEDRRADYRVNVVLPFSIQAETDMTEGELIERPINLSAGGIGVVVTVPYSPNEILLLTMRLPDQVIFKTYAEVLRLIPITYPANTYRLHARFIRMTTGNRELLTRYILRFQRDHLTKHYSV
jgi:c-di-GMP-binding flagellar brake protein YcgR